MTMLPSSVQPVVRSPGPEPPGDAAPYWHTLDPAEALARLDTHPEHGLTSAAAAERLHRFGRNELRERPRPTFLHLVLDQLNNFVIILLMVAAVISAALGDWVESLAILAIVVLNAVLGVIQERRAEEALAALRRLAAPEAHVLRDGTRRSVPAAELVPGDLVYLDAGRFVPADLRLVEAVNLRVEEAALTGESAPVHKNATELLAADAALGERENTAFMGTTVVYGRGQGLVVATGMHTQLGLIADLLQHVESEETPLQQRLDQLGRWLGWGALAVCAVVFLVGILRSGLLGAGFTLATRNAMVESFMVAVSLAIAAVPEGLPAVVTISLALGMREMVRRHALIRKLASVETLGSANVICSDKTGTLTQNLMTVTRLWVDGNLIDVTGRGAEAAGEFRIAGAPVDLHAYPGVETALWVGVLNNDAQLEPLHEQQLGPAAGEAAPGCRIIGDPTEGALLVAAAKAGVAQAMLNRSFPRRQEVPFDSTRKRMITIHAVEGATPADVSPFTEPGPLPLHAVTMKGAADIVLRLCTHYQTSDDRVRPLDDATRAAILVANDAMTHDALRVLGLAYRTVPQEVLDAGGELSHAALEHSLVFVGLVGMIDPPRPEVRPALATARRAGIRTIMITGDYPNTARAVADEIGLLQPGHKVLTGAELNVLDDAALAREVGVTDVFARVSPAHKLRIVDALRARGAVVAMTGDGVNDAPAIKRADIGIAMGVTGTDVAKETADMVLTDDNYASIVAAIEQGRVIYANIRKFVFFLLSSNVAEIMIIFLPTLAGLPTPLTAIQLLWLNLLTDGAPALALAMEQGDPDVMQHPPRPKHESIVDGPMRLGIGIQTVLQTGVTLAAFLLGLYWSIGGHIPAHVNPLAYLLSYGWAGVNIRTAQTMAFVTLSLCELFRAYTVRSERASIFQLGVFSNRYMQLAVGISLVLLLGVVTLPFLQPIFNTHGLTWLQWLVVVGLALLPACTEELTKLYLRWRDRRGEHPQSGSLRPINAGP